MIDHSKGSLQDVFNLDMDIYTVLWEKYINTKKIKDFDEILIDEKKIENFDIYLCCIGFDSLLFVLADIFDFFTLTNKKKEILQLYEEFLYLIVGNSNFKDTEKEIEQKIGKGILDIVPLLSGLLLLFISGKVNFSILIETFLNFKRLKKHSNKEILLLFNFFINLLTMFFDNQQVEDMNKEFLH